MFLGLDMLFIIFIVSSADPTVAMSTSRLRHKLNHFIITMSDISAYAS